MANASASKIDLSAFSTLTIVYDVVATSISDFRLVVNSAARDVHTSAAGVLGYATRTETAVVSNQTLVVDVSAMNQQAYIVFGSYAFGTVRVKAVYLA